jgi:hypothetical protein
MPQQLELTVEGSCEALWGPDGTLCHLQLPCITAVHKLTPLGKMPVEAAPRSFDYSLVPIPKNRYFVTTHGLTTTVCTVYSVDLLAQSHTVQQYRTVQLYHLLSETPFYAVFAILYFVSKDKKEGTKV